MNKTYTMQRLLMSCGYAVGIFLGAPTFAQTMSSQADKAGGPQAVGLEEVIITAQRRETNLQDTPIAVTAFTGAMLEQARVQTFDDLATKIPGFSIYTMSKSRQHIALRGGSSLLSSPGSDNAVALFVDDIYSGSSGEFEQDLFGIERIEVLKGPQGTLFGRNSTGGAIAIITRDPEATPAGEMEFGVGNHELLQMRGFITGPLDNAGELLGSVSFAGTSRDGTSYNRALDERVDDLGRMSIRGKLKWQMSDDVSFLLTGGYRRVSEQNEARDFLGATPTADSLQAIGFVPDSDPFVVDGFEAGEFNSKSWLVSGRFEADFEAGTFISITGYRQLDASPSPTDFLGLPVLLMATQEPRNIKQFSQEFRWVSDTGGAAGLDGRPIFPLSR